MADYPVLDGNGNVIIPAAWQDAGKELYPVVNGVGTVVVADEWLDAGKPQYPVYGGDGTLLISVEQGGGAEPPDPLFPPVNTSPPVISGNTVVGSVLTCAPGVYTNSPTSFAYQWRNAGVNIGGATGTTYTTVTGDIGGAVDCVEVASNADGSAAPIDSNNIVVTAAPAFAWANLAALFNGGAVDGIMIDLTSKDTLFQDVNGAAAVVSNGDPVGLALDQHKWGGLSLAAYRAAQAELVTDSNNPATWTASGGTLSVVGGKLRLTSTGTSEPYMYRSFTTVVGRWYETSGGYVSVSGGSGFLYLRIGAAGGNGSILVSDMLAGVGNTQRRWFKATATTTFITQSARSVSVVGAYAEFDNISVKEIDGHHATATTTARPLWQSATSDVLFDGSNDYLTTNDFYFQDYGNFLSVYFAGVSGINYRTMAGVYHSAAEYGSIGANNISNTVYASVGGTGVRAGTTSIQGATGTALLDQDASSEQIIHDGVLESSFTSSGPMPDAARTRPLFIGAENGNGAARQWYNGRIKRIVAGQVRVQDTMTAADVHANLIAA